MQTNKNEKTVHEPLFHISKRGEIKWWKSWLIRLSAILIVSLLCIILTCAFTKLSPFSAIGYMFSGNFGFGMAWDTIYNSDIVAYIARCCSCVQNEILEYRSGRSDLNGYSGLCDILSISWRKSSGCIAPCNDVRCEYSCKRYMGGNSRHIQGNMEYKRNFIYVDDELYCNVIRKVFP